MLFLHNEGSVMEGLKNDHSFYSLNFIPENIVCDNNAITDLVAISEQVGIMQWKVFMKAL